MKGDTYDLLKLTIIFGNCVRMEYITWDAKSNRFTECYNWSAKTTTGVLILLFTLILYNTLQGFEETRRLLYLVNVQVIPPLFYIIAYKAQKGTTENIELLFELDKMFLVLSVNLGRRSINSQIKIGVFSLIALFTAFMICWILWFAGLPILNRIEPFLIHQLLVATFMLYHVLSFYSYYIIFADKCLILTELIGNYEVDPDEHCVYCKIKTEWKYATGIRLSKVYFCEIHALR